MRRNIKPKKVLLRLPRSLYQRLEEEARDGYVSIPELIRDRLRERYGLEPDDIEC